MATMQLTFTPNTAFSDHIRSIRASDGALGLDEIHRRLGQQLPGADVSFADVVEEILEQSRAASRQGGAANNTTAAFAGQLELVSKLLALKEEEEGEGGEEEEEEHDDHDWASECSSEYSYETDGDFSSVVSPDSASSVEDDGDETLPLAFASQFAEVLRQIRLLSDLRGEDHGDDGSSVAPSDSISCNMGMTRSVADYYETDSESSSESGINPFDDPRYEILEHDLYER